jgi:hypothetical protein
MSIISAGTLELNKVTVSGCKNNETTSEDSGGGGIYSSISGSGKLTIKDGC